MADSECFVRRRRRPILCERRGAEPQIAGYALRLLEVLNAEERTKIYRQARTGPEYLCPLFLLGGADIAAELVTWDYQLLELV